MSKNIVCSSGSSSQEFLLDNNGVHCKRFADNARKRLPVDEALDSNIGGDRSLSNIAATESALRRPSKFVTLQESNLYRVESVVKLDQEEPTSANALDQMQVPTHINTFLAKSNAVITPVSIFPFPSAHTSCCKTQLEVRKTSVCKSVISSVHKEDKYSTLSGDNTTVSKVMERNSMKNKDFPQRNEKMVSACDKTNSRKSSNSLSQFGNEEIYHIDKDTSFEKSQSYFSNQLNSISFDEDALIHEFELQSLEDRMAVSECLGSEYEHINHSRSTQLVSSLTNSDRNTMELTEHLKFPDLEASAPHTRYSKASPKASFSDEVLFKETILYSDSSDFPETPSTIKADFSVPENLKCECDLSPTAPRQKEINYVLLKLKKNEDQFKKLSHAHSDPALTLNDTTDSGPLRKVKSSEKEHKLQFPDAQDLILPLISPGEIQHMGSLDHSGSEKTPSSENNVLTNGMIYVELETSSGGFLHQETDLSSSQLTYTEADVSSKALKVSDQDFSSSSLPYTEADVSSIEFPCTEQDIESSVMYTDADTSSNGLQYNEPDDTSSGWPQIDVDTNSTSKLHNEIDTSSYGISSNEFDASSSVFDSSSSGLPYIECESTNRLSYKTLQSCSSGHDVDSLSAGSSGVVGEEKSVPEPLPQPPISTNETPCKDQLKCFPF